MIGTSSRKDETLERLTDGIAQLTSSDSWRAWLKAPGSRTCPALACSPTASCGHP